MTIFSCLALLLLLIGCLFYAAPIQVALAETIFFCLQSIIPALYAVMIAAQLLIRTNGYLFFCKPFAWLFQKRLPPVCFAIFLMSQVAGYPVGAKLLDMQMQNGTLTRKQATLLTGVCFGSGPSFLFGTLAALTGKAGCWLLFFSMLSANILLLLLMIPFLSLPKVPETAPRRLTASMLSETVIQSGTALLQMCAMILFFRCLLTIAQASGLFPSSGLLCAFFEITSLTTLSPSTPWLFSLFAALLSFGGICVHLQIFAVTNGRISIFLVLLLRGVAALFAAAFCRIGCHLFPQVLSLVTNSRSVSAPVLQGSSVSPAASLLLLVATILLLQTAEQQKQMLKK